MQVSVTHGDGLERHLKVEVPSDQIETEISQRLKSLAGSVKMDGFRPGKVPMRVIERQYGPRVRQEVSQEMMQRTFRDAIAQEDLRPAGQPQIEAGDLEPGKSLEYTATFEVYPDVKITIPDDFTVEKPATEISDADVDTVIERLRKQHVTWEPVDREARDGDQLTVDFVGKLDGEVFEGGEAKNFNVVLGSNQLVGGFEDNLLGAKKGDTPEFDVTFPDDYPSEKLAGKVARFEVTVNSVAEPRMPDLDDEFVNRFGVTEGIDAFREQVRENIQREVDAAITSRVKSQVLEKLVEANTFDIPQALIGSEIEARRKQMRQRLMSGGVPLENINLDDAIFEENARKSVAVGLLVSEIIKENQLKVTPEMLRAKVESIAATYEDPSQVLNFYYGDQRRLAEVEAVLLEDAAVEWCVEQGKVVEKPTTVTELLDQGEAGGA
jgi:trigger factor